MNLTPRLPRFLPVAVPLICCLCAAPLAQAQTPYSAAISGTFSGMFTGPSTVHDTFTGTGVDTLGGAFTFTGMTDADISNLSHQLLTGGSSTLNYGAGNTLIGTFSGSLDNFSTLSSNHLFTGGTGTFVGIDGSATETGAVVFTDQTSGTFTLNLVGTVIPTAVPEPGSIALLAGMGVTGSLFAVCRLRRRRKRSCRSGALGIPAAALAIGILVSGAPAQAQLIINPTFDDASFIAAGYNPTDIHNGFNFAAQEFMNLYSDPIHVNINVRADNINLGESITTYFGNNTYASVRTALINDNTAHPSADGTTSAASLGAAEPTPTGSEFWLAKAQRKALGLAADDLTTDGTFLFANTAAYTFDPNNRQVPGKFDFIGVAEHEISEIMGRSGFSGQMLFSGSPAYTAGDLFRYSGAGVRVLGLVPNGYFSIDGGVTNLTFFNDSHVGDLFDYRGDLATDAFNFGTTSNQGHMISSVGITNLDVIGYDLRQNAVPEPGTISLLGAGLMTIGGLCLRRLRQRKK